MIVRKLTSNVTEVIHLVCEIQGVQILKRNLLEATLPLPGH